MPSNRPLHPPNHRGSRSRQSQPPDDRTDRLIKRLRSVRATEAFGRTIARELSGGEIIALTGELGAGKTVLVRGIAAGLGVSPQYVTSPTFTLIHEYHGRLRLVHADLYRIDHQAELESIGLFEYDNPTTTVIVEWADRLGQELPPDHLKIHLDHSTKLVRQITIIPHGLRSQLLFQRLMRQTSE